MQTENDIVRDTTIKAVIIEDNPDSLIDLKSMLNGYPEIEIIGEAHNGKIAVNIVDSLEPNLIFLDVQLPEMDGFEILQKIKHTPMVVFITAHDQYAVKAFEANGIDYILKPVQQDRLRIAIEKVLAISRIRNSLNVEELLKYIARKQDEEMKFSVKANDQILIVPQEDVYYFNTEDKYLFLNTDSQRYFYSYSLKKLEQILNSDLFIRINKSVIVSIKKIKKLKKNYLNQCKIVLNDKNQTSFKVSKKYLPEVKRKLNINLNF